MALADLMAYYTLPKHVLFLFGAKVSVEWWDLYILVVGTVFDCLPEGHHAVLWYLYIKFHTSWHSFFVKQWHLLMLSDTYKVISESLQSGMSSIFTSVTHHDVPFSVVPFRVYAIALTILPVLQALLQLTVGLTYMASDWSWISEIYSCEVQFYPYTEQRF